MRKSSKTTKTSARRKTSARSRAAANRPIKDGSKVIKVVDKENPRRKGTVQWNRYNTIIKSHGKTVEQFMTHGGDRDALRYAAEQNHVKLAGRG